MPVGALAWCHDWECLLSLLSQSLALFGSLLLSRRSSLLCCGVECVVEDELVM